MAILSRMEMEMEMEMEMRAVEEINIGQDLTPPLYPLAFSLYDSCLLSHCSICFSHISSPPSVSHHHSFFLYCSPQCSSAASSSYPHLSAAENHLIRSHISLGDTSDLRAALRLLFLFHNSGAISDSIHFPARLRGLLSNRENLIGSADNDEVLSRIRNGARAIAVARRMRDGLDLDFDGDCLVEEAVLCAVLTNAVEVQVKGGGNVGIAVYDTDFSWINHSCSPNACYRFLPREFSGGESQLRISPSATDGGEGTVMVDNGDERKCYGPRVVVRSIKPISKGEEVSIAYTDLLQPKELRQSELWLKYRFVCCCRRCIAFPTSYADLALQEVSVVNLDSTDSSSNQNFYREKEIQKLTAYIEATINDYLSLGNTESCCENLAKALTHGILNEHRQIRLHPLHHLSLNTYTTLASAYKVRATHLLDHKAESNYMSVFDMSRISSAYSFLLAISTHYLFLSEPSIIASVGNYWMYAGESLIVLARSKIWDFVLTHSDFAHFQILKSCKCQLLMKFEEDNFVGSHCKRAEFEDISGEFLHCITNLIPYVWNFLVSSDSYLQKIKDPLDFYGLRSRKSTYSFEEGFSGQERTSIFRLGVHCLLYGGFLSRICWGDDSYLTSPVQSILNSDGM